MSSGLRVVRGPHWTYGNDQDGGEGHVGTVVEIGGHIGSQTPEKHVTVVWDSGTRHQYRAGYEDAYDLYVYDNAQCGIFHPSITCTECLEFGIEGLRWKCLECENVELCSVCYMGDKHNLSHVFLRIDNPMSDGEMVPRRCDSRKEKLKACGIFTGAKVCPGVDWRRDDQDIGEGDQGEVTKVSEWGKYFKAEITVRWSSGSIYTHRLGAEGKVDLKCVIPAHGGPYYKNHLPIVGKMKREQSGEGAEASSSVPSRSGIKHRFKDQLDIRPKSRPLSAILLDMNTKQETASGAETSQIGLGYRVVRGPDWKWGSQDISEGFVGTVVDIGGSGALKPPAKCVNVQWDCGSRNTYRAGQDGCYDLLVFDNAPDGTRHAQVACSMCQIKDIKGLRWKCTDCENVDLCSSCYNKDKHDLGHQFVRIDYPWSQHNCKVPKRQESQKVNVMGIFPKAVVCRGHDWKWRDQDGSNYTEGRVVSLGDWTSDSGKSKVSVRWPSGNENAYRLGHEGKVDLKCVKPASGGFYYRSHLPILGIVGKRDDEKISRFKVGEKVRCQVDVEKLKELQPERRGVTQAMVHHLKKVGTVCAIDDDGDIEVQYQSGATFTYKPDALSQIWLNTADMSTSMLQNQTLPDESQTPDPGLVVSGLAPQALGSADPSSQSVNSADPSSQLVDSADPSSQLVDSGDISSQGVESADPSSQLVDSADPSSQLVDSPELSSEAGNGAAGNATEGDAMKRADQDIIIPSPVLKLGPTKEKPQCKICMEGEACVAFVPCGHLVSCPDCSTDLEQCPVCRAEIKHWLRTFII
ncbi:unnamed protein product [Lymnaea stagnalis]|uniref:RING-type E3 ubiquitin transferase n=1 Tax=Lymnaea stagnalis TaxID=6523 RepID=A0AAV2IB56_LYMST